MYHNTGESKTEYLKAIAIAQEIVIDTYNCFVDLEVC